MEQKTLTTHRDLSSLSLHILAMAFMLCDHLWATIVPGQDWLTCLGWLAYPIFAFCIAEGYFHTSNFKKYLSRILIWALLTEIPFNLAAGGYWIYPFHQNVLWSFALSLLCMRSIDKVRAKGKVWLTVPLGVLLAGVFYLLALLGMVDYLGEGVLTVLVFYLFRGYGWPQRLGQLAGIACINLFMIKGITFSVTLFGQTVDFPRQALALLALIPIWLYRGRQGPHNKVIRFCCYAFYPVHLLILGLLMMY